MNLLSLKNHSGVERRTKMQGFYSINDYYKKMDEIARKAFENYKKIEADHKEAEKLKTKYP